MNDPSTSGATVHTLNCHAPATAKPSLHRSSPITLPDDPHRAAALVANYIATGSPTVASGAVEAAANRVAVLMEAKGEQAEQELAGHLLVLDALFKKYAAESMLAGLPDHRAKFMKLALGAQAAYSRTAVTLQGLRSIRLGQGKVTLGDDSRSGEM